MSSGCARRWLAAAMALVLAMTVAASRTVEVDLTTTFLSSPVYPVLETSAFLAEVDPPLFFRYVDAIDMRAKAIQQKDSINYTTLALDAAHDVLPPDATIAKLLPFVLQTRAQSPKIEMFHQLAIESAYKGCGLAYEAASAWVVIYHETGCATRVVCAASDWDNALLTPSTDTSCAASGEHDFELHVDHVFDKDVTNAPTVLLYGTLGTSSFRAFHSKLAPLAEAKAVRYIVRHAPQNNVEPVHLQGYGVSLHIKNMEYKSFDDSKAPHSKHTPTDDDEDEFIVSVLMKKGAETGPALRAYQLEFEDFSSVNATENNEDAPWQLNHLGYLAASDILTSTDPLARLQQLAQNFPKYASGLALATEPIPSERIAAMATARRTVATQHLLNKIVVNGMVHDLSDVTFNPFDFVKLLAGEVQQGDALRALELDDTTLTAVHSAMTTLSTQASEVRVRVRGPVDGTAPLYLNAIESDEMTAEWPTDVSVLAEPAWNLIFLRRVMYEVILVLDPTTKQAANVLHQIHLLILRGAPVQFGVLWTSPELLALAPEDRETYVPATDDKAPASAYHVTKLYLAARDHGHEAAKQFLDGIVELGGGVTVKEALLIYVQAVTHRLDRGSALEAARDLLLSVSQDDGVWAMTDVVLASQLPLDSYVFNGVLRRDLNLQEGLMAHFGRDQPLYQELARAGKFSDDADLLEELYAHEGFYPVYSSWLDPSQTVPVLDLHLTSSVWDDVTYLHMPHTATKPKRQSLLLMVDLDTPAGARSAYNALKTTIETPDVRLSLVHLGTSRSSIGSRVSYMLHALADLDDARYLAIVLEILRFLSKAKSESDIVLHAKLLVQVHLDASPDETRLLELLQWIEETPAYTHPLPSLLSMTSPTLLINGRPLSLDGNQTLLPSLLSVLLQWEGENRSKAVARAFFAPTKRDALSVDAAATMSQRLQTLLAVVDAYLATPRTGPVFPTLDRHTTFATSAASRSLLDVIAYLDPLSEATQRASVVLRMLRDVLGAKITLVLTPTPSYTEFPLKRFYRYAWGSAPLFRVLPRPPVLTMNVETPELFNVQMVASDTDVDNIQGDATARYAVQSLLVYGQCIDRTMAYHPSPPNGLQLILERTAGADVLHRDTVVMKNLGYFQLQATPGVWRLELAKGRASELYEMVDQAASDHARVVVYDFSSDITQLDVKKRPGFEYARLLEEPEDQPAAKKEEDEATQSYWKSLVSWGTKQPAKDAVATRSGETIHVFSVATGHLYERMLKLMMLSVLKRTNNPVTFWLLENFLSPDFKKSVPALQSEFGMDIRLVTYKWPNWLRRQTEKQRIIWGYKILFLDVLFPLGVQKIIYVDADQVVRADLKELWHMDLHGKPYAYTPFCDSRNVGFQFWRQGYWKDHLRGKPYHISALYVVDLVKFRRMAAGDTLRAVYDQLSADPNSLSNLDQDLPNYAQHQIPIHSLPQEWLWCESWCSDESKASAKTIDLCNNPKHKEPKLEMAKRVISGEYFKESWLQLDDEVKAAEAAYATHHA